MQLWLPAAQSSRNSRSAWCRSSEVVMSHSELSGARRTSTATSTSPVNAPDWAAAEGELRKIGRISTTSRKLLRYCTQSHTTRTSDKSALLWLSAATTGSTDAPRSTGDSARKRAWGRKSISMSTARRNVDYVLVCPARETGAFKDLGYAVFESERHDVNSRDAGDLLELLDRVGAQSHSLFADTVRRHTPQSVLDLTRDVHPRHTGTEELKHPK